MSAFQIRVHGALKHLVITDVGKSLVVKCEEDLPKGHSFVLSGVDLMDLEYLIRRAQRKYDNE